jgi:hypothetical protein
VGIVSANEGDLRQALHNLVGGKERARRLVVRAGEHWQVLTADLGQSTLVHESVKSSRLPDALKLSPDAAQKMRGLDFAKGGGADWQRVVRRGELDTLAAQVIAIIREVHGTSAAIDLDLEIDDREHPSNPELIATMRELADRGGRTAESRQRMYNAMVNSTLVLPFDPEAGPEVDPEDAIERVDHRDGRPVFAAFTDFRHLRRWRPLATDYMPSHGSVLFEWLCEQQAASLLVNPEGQVGGELFGHELGMLAEGVRRFVKKHGA